MELLIFVFHLFFPDNDDDDGADDDNVVTNMPLAACFEWEQ